ncbi:hypothetical protein BJ878DRAFT_476114 [Calycina marina]|uniref:C2H2-type domain-containing protein n=1 Tax=Calycina marina TaxID=1763456 RepID=A0A9P8CIX4_9HELO|nr:hypothetical protein BJ878DRAFT_476114 [Calycina marina]
MCVKRFWGFICGHCSIPWLVCCPLSMLNPEFQPCSIPAWHAVKQGLCPGCFRIVCNAQTLSLEENHRQKHMRRKCSCTALFTGQKEYVELGRSREPRERGDGSGSGAVVSVMHEGHYVGHRGPTGVVPAMGMPVPPMPSEFQRPVFPPPSAYTPAAVGVDAPQSNNSAFSAMNGNHDQFAGNPPVGQPGAGLFQHIQWTAEHEECGGSRLPAASAPSGSNDSCAPGFGMQNSAEDDDVFAWFLPGSAPPSSTQPFQTPGTVHQQRIIHHHSSTRHHPRARPRKSRGDKSEEPAGHGFMETDETRSSSAEGERTTHDGYDGREPLIVSSNMAKTHK